MTQSMLLFRLPNPPTGVLPHPRPAAAPQQPRSPDLRIHRPPLAPCFRGLTYAVGLSC